MRATRTETGEELEGDLQRQSRRPGPGGQESGSDGSENTAEPHERDVMSPEADEEARNQRGEHDGHKEREIEHARVPGRVAFGGLEVEGKVVGQGTDDHGHEKHESTAEEDSALLEDSVRNGGIFTSEVLEHEVCRENEDCSDETASHMNI